MRGFIVFTLLILSAYAVGVYSESINHAYALSEQSGAAYARVFVAWVRLMHSERTDTDCYAFDVATGANHD